jgi:pimeloyl-ACP methyl ester carboxylesterase
MLPPCSFTLPDSRAGFRIEGRGRPVVLLHDAMGAKAPWRALVERMNRGHRMIETDLQGSTTPGAPDSFALKRDVALVESVLRVGLLPGERFHLVGHAYGAAVALRIAQARPQRLHSLTLFEPKTAPATPGTDDCRRVTMPTCLLSLDRGGEPAHEQLDALASALPLARRQRVPGAHADLVRVIDGFIRGVDALELPTPARVAMHG